MKPYLFYFLEFIISWECSIRFITNSLAWQPEIH